MARRKDSPQKAAMREMMRDYLKNNDISIKDGTDVNGIMRDMMSVLLEGALDEELDEELGYSKYDYRNKETDNSRNGHSSKTMHTSYGDMDVAIPRDRNGDYEPQLIKKYQNTVTQDMEEKILSMYAKGMTTGDIESHMRELYDIDISDSTISRITDKILPIVKEWQERPLEEVYAVVFMDAIHYHVRSEGRIVKRAVYIALGIDMSGKKDVLGMYVGENESAKFWLSIMNGLKNRGVEDILIACVDGLNGFPQAIEAVYPKTEIQQCIIHQIRNSTKFVSYKDIKKLMDRYRHLGEIIPLPCPGLMNFVERGDLYGDDVRQYLEELLYSYSHNEIDAVVLGCTHYPFVRKMIQEVLGDRVRVFDGGNGTAREMKRRLAEKGLLTDSTAAGIVDFQNSLTGQSHEDKIQLCKTLFNKKI